MPFSFRYVAVGLLVLPLTQCKTPDSGSPNGATVSSSAATGDAGGVDGLPELTTGKSHETAVAAAIRAATVEESDQSAYVERIAHYLGFLGLEPGSPAAKKVLSDRKSTRLNSSH